MALRFALLVALLLALPAAASAHGEEGVITHMDTREELAAVDVAGTAAAAALPGALPYRWCGEARATDDTAHAVLSPATPRFKMVYAHPADRPDRSAAWRDAIQANVALIQRFLAGQTGGAKALRIDMGTSCGPQYVDVQTVRLPAGRAAYVDNFSAIVRDVEARLGAPAGPRNVVVLADTLNGGGYDYGLGENVLGSSGDRPGSGNVHNRGGFASVLFTRDGVAAPVADNRGWWPEGFLHEMTHNLGGVQWSAPHSTQPAGFQLYRYGHCWQGYDVMCYVEDAGASHAMRYDCPRVGGAIPQAYDCGRDDYFNPAPAPGSYLARAWNVYDSAFFGSCAQVAPACGGGLEGLAPTPPVSTGTPLVVGSPRRGRAVSAGTGAWRNGPFDFRYRWQREGRDAWVDIAGATATSYTPGRRDRGRRLRVQVIATNPDGSAVAASPATVRVADVGVSSAQRTSRGCRAAKGRRARRSAARCRGRRNGERASARHRSPRRRTSASVRATQRYRATGSVR